ncbi:hypothetical protein V6N11_014176 [Hibiscus sabdariffa]|uniref:Uncharacterized protein n=1 Tax=Hibiscus sabdariffa TaxID=183260 RepID=A0ABR2AGG4_9ROSI
MLEGASPLSDRSASSRKSEEVITDEPHAGKLARVGDRSTSFFIALGLCLDLLRAKSEGLVPMGIPLGLIPRLMTKGESAWRKVKIEGSREKFPSGLGWNPCDGSRVVSNILRIYLRPCLRSPARLMPVRIRGSRASHATFSGRNCSFPLANARALFHILSLPKRRRTED